MQIVVVDRQPLIHEAIRALAQGIEPACEVTGATCEADAWRAIDARPELELAVIDVPADATAWTVAFIERLHARRPTLPILALGSLDDRATVAGAVAAGAAGYVPKSAGGSALLAAVRLLLEGGCCLPPGALGCGDNLAGTPARLTRRARRRIGLTLRQSEVLALIAEGKPNKLICRELRLSEGTVKVHVSAVLRALKVANRTQAALAATRVGGAFPGTGSG